MWMPKWMAWPRFSAAINSGVMSGFITTSATRAEGSTLARSNEWPSSGFRPSDVALTTTAWPLASAVPDANVDARKGRADLGDQLVGPGLGAVVDRQRRGAGVGQRKGERCAGAAGACEVKSPALDRDDLAGSIR